MYLRYIQLEILRKGLKKVCLHKFIRVSPTVVLNVEVLAITPYPLNLLTLTPNPLTLKQFSV